MNNQRNKIASAFNHFLAEVQYQSSRLIGSRLSYPRGRVVVLSSAHKVGSTWLFDMITELGKFKKIPPPRSYNDTGTLIIDRDDLSDYFRYLPGRRIFKSHSYPPNFNYDRHIKLVNIFRDPRDVIVSSIFYLASLDPRLGGWGAEFKSLNEPERILHFIRKGDFSLTRLEKWFVYKSSYKVRYEDLLVSCADQLGKLFDWLELPINQNEIDKTIQMHSFENRSKRKPGLENKDSFFRKGIRGDWRNYFDRNCIRAFKTEKGGRWNRLLLDMEYEQAEDWNL
jgi:hypothetical protein